MKPSRLTIASMLAIAASVAGSTNVSVDVPFFSTKAPRNRTPEDIEARRAKQKAKLARRAARYG
jgi:hypothetical protein